MYTYSEKAKHEHETLAVGGRYATTTIPLSNYYYFLFFLPTGESTPRWWGKGEISLCRHTTARKNNSHGRRAHPLRRAARRTSARGTGPWLDPRFGPRNSPLLQTQKTYTASWETCLSRNHPAQPGPQPQRPTRLGRRAQPTSPPGGQTPGDRTRGEMS